MAACGGTLTCSDRDHFLGHSRASWWPLVRRFHDAQVLAISACSARRQRRSRETPDKEAMAKCCAV